MRIALLTDGITPYVTGGMQRHSFHLARHLLLLGVDITLVHCVPLGTPIPSQADVHAALGGAGNLRSLCMHFTNRKPTVLNGDKLPGHYVRESYRYACRVYEQLEGEWGHFDFIYAKGFTAWRLLELKRKGVHMAPIGVKFHGYEMYQRAAGVKERLAQFLLRPPVVFNNREANVVFSYGGEISEIIHRMGVPLEHIVEIGSAVDDSWIASQPLPQQGVRRFIFVGRYEARKGLQDLRRCREALGTLPVEFHFVGAIPEHMRLSMPNCTYHGEVRDAALLRSLLDSAQVLVAPSRSEGMPNVILEAMARGLAIIATEVGAVPAMVSGLNGVRIPPARPAALRQALRTFAHMPQPELDALRKESIRIADTCFRWSLVAVATLAAIKERTHAVPRT